MRCVSNDLRLKDSVILNIPAVQITIKLPDFVETLKSRPKDVIGSIGIALSVVLYYRNNMPNPQLKYIHPISPRLYNLQPYIPYSELKSGALGKLVSVVGYVVRVSHSHHLITGGTFICNKCLTSFMVYFEDGIYSPPTVCPTPK
jgi:DNA replicative helicase MCM subunit Mcm2 (Cdc46/Mcm family)